MQGIPLEEVAAIFGDADEVAIYQRDLEIDTATHTIIDRHHGPDSKRASVEAAHLDQENTSTDSNQGEKQ